nr:hypothetical protein [Tanacetum cinerariifolium]
MQNGAVFSTDEEKEIKKSKRRSEGSRELRPLRGQGAKPLAGVSLPGQRAGVEGWPPLVGVWGQRTQREEDAFLVDYVEGGLCIDNADAGIIGRCNSGSNKNKGKVGE